MSQSVPGIMVPGQVYAVSVTMQNTGTSTWAPGSYYLGSENPQANTTWGLNRVELTAPVAPGANVTLNFNVTAPSTAGMYNFQWRMVQDSTQFGAFTTNVAVNVQQAQAQNLYYVHADHLNTPRLVADATGTTVWRWDQLEPFGNTGLPPILRPSERLIFACQAPRGCLALLTQCTPGTLLVLFERQHWWNSR